LKQDTKDGFERTNDKIDETNKKVDETNNKLNEFALSQVQQKIDIEVDIIYINYGYRLHEEFLLRFKYEIDEFSNFILNPNDVKEIGIFYYSVSPRDQNPIIRIKDDCIIILGEYNYKYDKV